MSEGAVRFIRSGQVIARVVAGEMVLIPRGARVTETGTRGAELYVLNGVAGDLWRWLEAPHSAEDLARKLTEEYDVAPGTAKDDIDAFLEALSGLGAVKSLEESA